MPRVAMFSLVLLAAGWSAARADGPADNVPTSVRKVPKPGIALKPEVVRELEASLAELKGLLDKVPARERPAVRELLPDVQVIHKAVHDALKYNEFFAENEIPRAKSLLKLGISRANALVEGKPDWPSQKGLVVRGYRSKIDDSVQPYGLVVPASYSPNSSRGYRLDVWFHGRGETLSELNFLEGRRTALGEFAPPDTIVLHPYGRYCNANKFAGEVDVLEAIDAVKKHYKIDDDRISVRGFSMGGAACWQFAVHYPDRWFAANPGAGFSETPRFLKVFQRETLTPTPYEQTLWHLYDCTDYAVNLAQCPTVAYSGELDNQKQAADVMAEALLKEGIDLVHVIGPGTKHAYHPAAKVEVERRMASLASLGRQRVPREVHFVTYTLKYNQCNWVTVDRLGEHWKKARVDAAYRADGSIKLKTENVEELTLAFPSGYCPFPVTGPVTVVADGVSIEASRPGSDRSWSLTLHRDGSRWAAGKTSASSPRKSHDLQGPIDDAFMDSFVFVRPTGKSPRAKFQAWVDQEMACAIEQWRTHFRGEVRVVDDVKVGEAEINSSHLVLWGDADSNAYIKKHLADRLGAKELRVADQTYDAENHALIAVLPNPANPSRYVVLNSGFTFREYDYLNNARQVPKLPDWAVIDLRTPPDARYPGKVVAADFFDEDWRFKTSQP
ncbi:MAG: prolyl oligopeptidase family serine peptidase [Isosphaeraceae bacterium]